MPTTNDQLALRMDFPKHMIVCVFQTGWGPDIVILRFPSLSSLVLPSFRFFLDFRLLGRRHDSGGEYLNTGQYERDTYIYIWYVMANLIWNNLWCRNHQLDKGFIPNPWALSNYHFRSSGIETVCRQVRWLQCHWLRLESTFWRCDC